MVKLLLLNHFTLIHLDSSPSPISWSGGLVIQLNEITKTARKNMELQLLNSQPQNSSYILNVGVRLDCSHQCQVWHFSEAAGASITEKHKQNFRCCSEIIQLFNMYKKCNLREIKEKLALMNIQYYDFFIIDGGSSLQGEVCKAQVYRVINPIRKKDVGYICKCMGRQFWALVGDYKGKMLSVSKSI